MHQLLTSPPTGDYHHPARIFCTYIHVAKCRYERERERSGRELLICEVPLVLTKVEISQFLTAKMSHAASSRNTGARAEPGCHAAPLPASTTANGSRTPFSGRHPSSRRSPLSTRCMCLGNRHRRSRTPRHVADGKRFVCSVSFLLSREF